MTLSVTLRRLILAKPGRTTISIDLFMDRMQPRPGHSLDDMVRTLVATSLVGATRVIGQAEFSPRFEISNIGGIASNGLKHPVGIYAPGAVVPIESETQSACGAETWTIDGADIIAPDGTRYDVEAFAPTGYSMLVADHDASRHLEVSTEIQETPLLAIALGAIAAIYPRPYAHRLSQRISVIPHTVGARAARLITTCKGGREGAQTGWSEAANLQDTLIWTWSIAPDRGWLPTQSVLTPRFAALLATADPDLLKIGRAAAEVILGTDEEILLSDAVLDGEDERLSNHGRLMLKAAMEALDQAIEDAAPLDLLKPAARKRREKRDRNRAA